MKNKIIKSSSCSIKFANIGKLDRLNSFIDDYRDAVKIYLDFLFFNKFSFISKDKIKHLDIKNDCLDCPKFYPKNDLNSNSPLSARALKCASTQALGIVKSLVKKRSKYLFVLKKLRKQNKPLKKIKKLLKKTKVTYPNIQNINPELNSICCNLKEVKLVDFDNVIILSSIGKKYGKIIIPIKETKHSNLLKNKGKQLKSYLITKKNVHIRYELNKVQKKIEGKVVGADQGIVTCVTLSDNQTTKKCNHGHDLRSIIKKICRKRQGSKAFDRAKEHQKNYINWSINQLNLKDVKELRAEKISNFRCKKNVGKFLNHFGEALIMKKLKDVTMLQGVQLIEQDSAYRSQRCSKCGFVYRGNRKGKKFKCHQCFYEADADYNASCNHEQDLPSARLFRYLKEKPNKFYWKKLGFYNLLGQELTVPEAKKR